MHYPDHPSADITVNPLEPRYTNGSPQQQIDATVVTAEWLNDILFNLMRVLDEGNITPTKGREQDLRDAIAAMIATSAPSETVKISASDTTPKFLEDALVTGTGLSLATQNTGANETRELTHDFATQAEGQAGVNTEKPVHVQRVTEMITANANPIIEKYRSAPTAFTLSAILNFTHSFSGIPDLIICTLYCKAPNNSFAVGDEVFLNPATNSAGGSNHQGIAIFNSNTTSLSIKMSSSRLEIISPASGLAFEVNENQWDIVAYAYKF